MKFSIKVTKTEFNPIDLNIKIETIDELEELLIRFNIPRGLIPTEFYPEIRTKTKHNFSKVFAELTDIYDSL